MEISIKEINEILDISTNQSSILRQYSKTFPKPTPETAERREKRYYRADVLAWKAQHDPEAEAKKGYSEKNRRFKIEGPKQAKSKEQEFLSLSRQFFTGNIIEDQS